MEFQRNYPPLPSITHSNPTNRFFFLSSHPAASTRRFFSPPHLCLSLSLDAAAKGGGLSGPARAAPGRSAAPPLTPAPPPPRAAPSGPRRSLRDGPRRRLHRARSSSPPRRRYSPSPARAARRHHPTPPLPQHAPGASTGPRCSLKPSSYHGAPAAATAGPLGSNSGYAAAAHARPPRPPVLGGSSGTTWPLRSIDMMDRYADRIHHPRK